MGGKAQSLPGICHLERREAKSKHPRMPGAPSIERFFARWVGKHNPFQASVILSGAKRSRKIRGCFQGCRVLHVSPLRHGNPGRRHADAGCPIHRALFARWVGKHNPFQASVILSGAKRSRKIRGCFQGCRVLHVSPLRHGNPGCRHDPEPTHPIRRKRAAHSFEPFAKDGRSKPSARLRRNQKLLLACLASRQPWQTMATLFANRGRPWPRFSRNRGAPLPRFQAKDESLSRAPSRHDGWPISALPKIRVPQTVDSAICERNALSLQNFPRLPHPLCA